MSPDGMLGNQMRKAVPVPGGAASALTASGARPPWRRAEALKALGHGAILGKAFTLGPSVRGALGEVEDRPGVSSPAWTYGTDGQRESISGAPGRVRPRFWRSTTPAPVPTSWCSTNITASHEGQFYRYSDQGGSPFSSPHRGGNWGWTTSGRYLRADKVSGQPGLSGTPTTIGGGGQAGTATSGAVGDVKRVDGSYHAFERRPVDTGLDALEVLGSGRWGRREVAVNSMDTDGVKVVDVELLKAVSRAVSVPVVFRRRRERRRLCGPVCLLPELSCRAGGQHFPLARW